MHYEEMKELLKKRHVKITSLGGFIQAITKQESREFFQGFNQCLSKSIEVEEWIRNYEQLLLQDTESPTPGSSNYQLERMHSDPRPMGFMNQNSAVTASSIHNAGMVAEWERIKKENKDL